MQSQVSWDIAIVGAGLAGVCTAAVLGRTASRVVLIDPRETYPHSFKAEKIELDQAALFRKFGLFDRLLPATGRVHEVVSAKNGRVFDRIRLEQYGIAYHDMVNLVRAQVPTSVRTLVGRVESIQPDSQMSTVRLLGGETLAARLVVLAAGVSGRLLEGLGIRRQMIRPRHSLAIGFDVARTDGQPFPFNSLTYYPDDITARLGYLTLFPIRNVMRANYFVYHEPGDEWTAQFTKAPKESLQRDFPKLTTLTGDFRVSSRVEMGVVDLYRTEAAARPGLVLLGDVFQSPCPTTGTGVSKVLTDVDVLCHACLPGWLSTPGMDVDKIAQFYNHPDKVACDKDSLAGALYWRRVSTDPSIRWSMHRRLKFWWQQLKAWSGQPRDLGLWTRKGKAAC